MKDPRYWIWLQNALGQRARISEAAIYFKSAEEIYFSKRVEWALSGCFTAGQIEKMHATDLSLSDSIINDCEKTGIKIITPEDDEYPVALRTLSDLPAVLFIKGNITFLNEGISISIVGTRNPSETSISIARTFSFEIASSGAFIVSGGAKGIDTAAHLGALDANQKTAAILGCGLNVNYLSENRELRERISENGVLISEYPPNVQGSKFTFPQRNRIISGLSSGTLIIEAGEKSGSLITANLADLQGKDVFAVPGDIINSAYKGGNNLIRDGAKPVFEPYDVICEYMDLHFDKTKRSIKTTENIEKKIDNIPQKIEKRVLPNSIGEKTKKVYEVLSTEPKHINELAVDTKMEMNILLASLTELEMFGFVELLQGRFYRIK